MKIRTGYVSNSSSSSFIILFDEGATVKLDDFEWSVDDLLDYVENVSHDWSSECTQVKAVGKELTVNFIRDRWYDDGQNRKVIEAVENSPKNSAAVLNVSYHDPITMKLFNLLKNHGQIEVVTEEEA